MLFNVAKLCVFFSLLHFFRPEFGIWGYKSLYLQMFGDVFVVRVGADLS